MLQESMMGQRNIIDSSLNSDLKLLDINISFDNKYPTITYTYFDIKNKKEIIDTYQAFDILLGLDNDDKYINNESFFDMYLKANNICFIAKK